MGIKQPTTLLTILHVHVLGLEVAYVGLKDLLEGVLVLLHLGLYDVHGSTIDAMIVHVGCGSDLGEASSRTIGSGGVFSRGEVTVRQFITQPELDVILALIRILEHPINEEPLIDEYDPTRHGIHIGEHHSPPIVFVEFVHQHLACLVCPRHGDVLAVVGEEGEAAVEAAEFLLLGLQDDVLLLVRGD